jgi:hypothetical protein
LLRRPFEPSIQMYSARTLPLWSNFMYLANWEESQICPDKGRQVRKKTYVGSVGNNGGFTHA